MSAPRIAAIDLSMTNSGLVTAAGLASIKTTAPGNAAPLEAHCRRYLIIRDQVLAAVADHDLVVIEGFSYASKGAATVDIGGLGWIVRTALVEAGLLVAEISPSTVKQYATGKGGASKDEVFGEAIRRLGYRGNDKNLSDALWLHAVAMHYYGCPVVEVPKTHQKALAKLVLPVLGKAA